jgi:hypothetical protein
MHLGRTFIGGIRMDTKKITIKSRNYEIVNGPSRDTLFDACKYACTETAKITIDLSVAIAYTMPLDHPGCACVPMDIHDVTIYGIEHDNGTGYCFILRGYCKAILSEASKEAKLYKFEAHYNTKTRSGDIALSDA